MQVLDLKHCVISVPDRDWPPAVVVYGGLYNLEGKWLLTKISQSLQESVVFVLPKHYTYNCGACLNELEKNIDPAAIRSYSLCGYSRGGLEVYRYRALRHWKILGLIDPSAPTLGEFADTVLDADVDKIRCVYWVPNWGKTGYGGRVPRFAKHLRDLKVDMVEKATNHFEMPTLFFNEYGDAFL